MNTLDFVRTHIMPLFVTVAHALDTTAKAVTYNARKDSPMLLGKVNALCFELRESMPNRHKTLAANVVLNGSLKSVSHDKLITSETFRDRLRAFLVSLVENRSDVRDLIGCKDGAAVGKLSATSLLEAYKLVSAGAVNAEDYGFYRNSCGSSYRSASADALSGTIEKSGRNGEYVITFAGADRAFSKANKLAEKREAAIKTAREKKSADAKAAKEKNTDTK